MQLNKLISFAVILSALFIQLDDKDGYYLFPINPGETNYLSGTMGEIRGTHFHAGLDIRTGGAEGLKVYATADGFISRIGVSEGGYGNALYMMHPNGTTSVYAHLKRFDPSIEEFVKEKQYHFQKFTVNLFPEVNQFFFKKGDVIGYSGNSGSSGGPHLHFEIRDGNQVPMDPLQFGFNELKDDVPPVVKKLAIVTKDIHSRVNNQFGRFEFDVVDKGGYFGINEDLTIYGKVGIELLSHDRLNESTGRYGIPWLFLTKDSLVHFGHHLKKIPFHKSKQVWLHSNYEQLVSKYKKWHKLYREDGNDLNIYKGLQSDGIISIYDNEEHIFEVQLQDAYLNSSSLRLTAKGNSQPNESLSYSTALPENQASSIYENVIKFAIRASNNDQKVFKVYSEGTEHALSPSYSIGNKRVYLWQVKDGIPDSTDFYGITNVLNYRAVVPSGKTFAVWDPRMDIVFNKNSLFDSLLFKMAYYNKPSDKFEIFEFGSIYSPVQSSFSITLRPTKTFSNPSRVNAYQYKSRNNYSFVGGSWSKPGYFSFKSRKFGKYVLLEDTTPPTISPLKLSSNRVSFRISDQLSGVKSYQTFLDGNWLLMKYDRKNNLIWSSTRNGEPISGELKLVVTDRAGNQSTFKKVI